MGCLMNYNSNFFSALAGALIGGLATFAATWWQHFLENKRKKSDSNNAINATLQAIRAELDSLRKRYMETIGSQLESSNDDAPFLFYYYATEDYFTIYSQNASAIGQIENDGLGVKIVAVYIQIKSLLDTYKSNNYLLEKYNYYFMLYSETESLKHQEQALGYHKLLLNYLPYIKESHKKAMNLGTTVINEITTYLASQCKS